MTTDPWVLMRVQQILEMHRRCNASGHDGRDISRTVAALLALRPTVPVPLQLFQSQRHCRGCGARMAGTRCRHGDAHRCSLAPQCGRLRHSVAGRIDASLRPCAQLRRIKL